MSIRNLVFGANSVTVSYLIRYDSLLQNATDVTTKCDNYFITKCDRTLLENASGFLLQNAAVLLQNATVITKCDDFSYKLRQYTHQQWDFYQKQFEFHESLIIIGQYMNLLEENQIGKV